MNLQGEFLQFLISGIVVGSIYALIALGFVTIYSVTGIINFAQGEFAVYGAFLAISLYQRVNLLSGNVQLDLGLPLVLAAFLAVVITTLLGLALYRLGIQPARNPSILSMIIITVGAAFVLRGVALLVWGTDPYRLPAFSEGAPLKVLGAVITRQNLWVVVVTGVLLAILYFFFNYTVTGKALRACAVNPGAARLMGIPIRRMALIAFGLSAAVTAIAGIVIAPTTFMVYERGLALSLKGFVAAAVGGMTNPAGAVAGGLLLGIVEQFGAGWLSAGYRDAISFVILFIVLALRMSGFRVSGFRLRFSRAGEQGGL